MLTGPWLIGVFILSIAVLLVSILKFKLNTEDFTYDGYEAFKGLSVNCLETFITGILCNAIKI